MANSEEYFDGEGALTDEEILARLVVISEKISEVKQMVEEVIQDGTES